MSIRQSAMLTIGFLVVAVGVLPCHAQQKEFPLTHNSCIVVKAEQAEAQRAATELQDYIEKITGKKVPIEYDHDTGTQLVSAATPCVPPAKTAAPNAAVVILTLRACSAASSIADVPPCASDCFRHSSMDLLQLRMVSRASRPAVGEHGEPDDPRIVAGQQIRLVLKVHQRSPVGPGAVAVVGHHDQNQFLVRRHTRFHPLDIALQRLCVL